LGKALGRAGGSGDLYADCKGGGLNWWNQARCSLAWGQLVLFSHDETMTFFYDKLGGFMLSLGA